MATTADRADRYADLFAYAQSKAEQIVMSPQRPSTSHAVRMYGAALTLLQAAKPEPAVREQAMPRSAAHDVLDVLLDGWPQIAAGQADGSDLMRIRPGLWRRLMTQWPMMEYADLLLETLPRVGDGKGLILEVGCGMGNVTARLASRYGKQLVWTDRERSIVQNNRWPGTGRVFDFDVDPPGDLGTFETVVACNALHCAADIGRTLARLRRLLASGGTLLIAEGSSPTRSDGTPWALDLLFSAFDGWWNRSGFLTRRVWVEALARQGFGGIESVTLETGADDLGGVIWATKR